MPVDSAHTMSLKKLIKISNETHEGLRKLKWHFGYDTYDTVMRKEFLAQPSIKKILEENGEPDATSPTRKAGKRTRKRTGNQPEKQAGKQAAASAGALPAK